MFHHQQISETSNFLRILLSTNDDPCHMSTPYRNCGMKKEQDLLTEECYLYINRKGSVLIEVTHLRKKTLISNKTIIRISTENT